MEIQVGTTLIYIYTKSHCSPPKSTYYHYTPVIIKTKHFTMQPNYKFALAYTNIPAHIQLTSHTDCAPSPRSTLPILRTAKPALRIDLCSKRHRPTTMFGQL